MPNKKARENRAVVEKRVLEAQKVVVSNMLYEWRKKYGMDYLLVVRNGPGDVFSRVRVGDEGRVEVLQALEGLAHDEKAIQQGRANGQIRLQVLRTHIVAESDPEYEGQTMPAMCGEEVDFGVTPREAASMPVDQLCPDCLRAVGPGK